MKHSQVHERFFANTSVDLFRERGERRVEVSCGLDTDRGQERVAPVAVVTHAATASPGAQTGRRRATAAP